MQKLNLKLALFLFALPCLLNSCRTRETGQPGTELQSALPFADETIDAADYFATSRQVYEFAIAELKNDSDLKRIDYGDAAIASLRDVGFHEGYEKELRECLAEMCTWIKPETLQYMLMRTPNQIFAQIAELKHVDVKALFENAKSLAPARDVPLPELVFVRLYTSKLYLVLNDALRSGNKAKYSAFKNTILTIGSGLNHLPHHIGIVKRGLKIHPSLLPFIRDRYDEKKKDFITEWSFTSTSIGEVKFAFQGNVELDYFSISGTPIAPFSDYKKENEVLFAPGADFYVCSAEDVEATYGSIFLVKMIQKPLKKSDCARFDTAEP